MSANPAPAGRADPLPAALVLVAGAGRLPELVAGSLDRAGRPYRILAIRGFAERAMRARAAATVDLLDIAGILAVLKRWGPVSVVPAGGVSRPNPAAILNAAAALRNREALRAISGGGDDRLLRGALALLEENGHGVVGVHEVAPDLLSPAGVMGRHRPDAAAAVSIAAGQALLGALSPHDVGQAAVLAGQRALAVEGPEGTDRMLARARSLARRPLGFGRAQAGIVLVKLAKVGQDLRVDLPAIGPRTVANAAAAGCVGLAVQARFTLIIDRPATIAAADRAGLFLVGLDAETGMGARDLGA
ncbi:UDP-2,3-diacylglucosamine diphosphatase LpxI [Methylobacterium sp. J-078]|uniref:LpxI family protein n=1 Tax=Methylobacterium sp. J-078 TaxID=2836657 RepID=UPI001FBB8CD5|nr:UDP-2,3-diacylglucosamine diphosphatase LpxI [Methylobacterium sp. J-078]MCJ2047904.1 UDP-2,3-diacylglucosamine diphosphatase LpxI [Methylobacterium sp. J-078]